MAYTNPDLLADVEWLHARLDDENILIVDCQWDPNAYLRAHIPNAVMRPGHPFVKRKNEDGTITENMPDEEEFAEMRRQMGITPEKLVVIYDEWGNHFASRLWWLLTNHGHKQVKVLNGGWQAWVAAGFPISFTEIKPQIFESVSVSQCDESAFVDVKELLNNYDNPLWQVIDVRTKDEYEGTDESWGNKRLGHIPGAIHLEWKEMLKPSSEQEGVRIFKNDREMEQKLQSAGVSRDKTIVVHCQSGVRAASMAFSLRLLGYNDVRVYDASMAEWANRDDTPME